MSLGKIRFKKIRLNGIRWNQKRILIVLSRHDKTCLWLFDKREGKTEAVDSIDQLKKGDFGKAVLILGRELYVFKSVFFPGLKKTLAEKAIEINIDEWSPFNKSRYFFSSFQAEKGVHSSIAILNGTEFEQIVNIFRKKDIQFQTIVPETFCLEQLFDEGQKSVGIIEKTHSLELIYFDGGIRESRSIERPKWDRNKMDFFLRSLGKEANDLKNIVWVGPDQEKISSSLDKNYSIQFMENLSEWDVLIRGSGSFNSSTLKPFTRNAVVGFSESDLAYLKPAALIIFCGVLLYLLSVFVFSYKQINYLNNKLERIKTETLGLNEKANAITSLRSRVNFIDEFVQSQPGVLFIFSELQARMPEGTVLIRLAFFGTKIEIDGLSSRASEFITRLNESSYISTVEMVSPIAKDNNTGKEQFHLALELNQ